VITTCLAADNLMSIAKVVIPGPDQLLCIVLHKFVEALDLGSGKPSAILKPNRVRPEFGNLVVAFDVDMGWFIAVACEEKEPV
jgi:hypothetical protein